MDRTKSIKYLPLVLVVLLLLYPVTELLGHTAANGTYYIKMENKNDLKIVAWNMNCSFSSAHMYLNELMVENDIVVISEHALFPCEHYKLNYINSDFYFDPVKSYSRLSDENFGTCRGQGGVAIGWRKDLSNIIKPLDVGKCDRICALQVNLCDMTLFIVGVYMPHASCIIADYKQVLSELDGVLIDMMSKGEVILIGDVNCHFSREIGPRGWGRTSPNGKLFINQLQQYNMVASDMGSNCTGPTYTFSSTRGSSYIDHCFTSRHISDRLNCEILEDTVNNVSDHLPIRAVLDISSSIVIEPTLNPRQVSWRKASAEQINECYTSPLEEKFNSIITAYAISTFHTNPTDYKINGDKVDEILNEVHLTLMSQSDKLPQRVYNKKLKPYWTNGLTLLNKDNKKAKQEWVNAGRPDNPLHPAKVKYKAAKNNFRREQRRIRLEYDTKCLEELSATQEVDQKYFWFLVNKTRKKQQRVRPIQSDKGKILTDVNEIREDWNEYYKRLLNEYDGEIDVKFNDHVNHTLIEINKISPQCEFLEGGIITGEEIRKHVTKMKSNKAPGWDGITVEHIRHGGYTLQCVIAWLLNTIIVSEKIPFHFKKGLIAPIPKGHQNSMIKGNHRGITLMPVLYKILECIMLERDKEYFTNVIHELQGAGQDGCSSIHTSMALQEAIDYNRCRGANVWVAFLDIRKAFDTVWIPGMLYKLYETGMNPKVRRIIANGYSDFMCAAFIAGKPGNWFIQSRGVHQGSPISMKIYQIYVNDLIRDLCNCAYSFSIGKINITAPTFADDLSMLAYHTMGMNQLLGRANQYSVKWQFSFGLPKCTMMLWGHEREPYTRPKLGNQTLTMVSSTKHMGINISHDIKKNHEDINSRVAAAQSVILSARGIGSHVSPVPPLILSKIYWAISIPKMTYGLEVKPVTDMQIDVMEKAHR